MLTRHTALTSQRPWMARYAHGVPHTIDYPEEPASWLLEHTAQRVPQRIACHFLNQHLTYGQLFAEAAAGPPTPMRAATACVPGDRVGLLLPNTPEYLMGMFGTWMAGGIVVPFSPLMVAEEVGGLVRSTECKIVITLDVLMHLFDKNSKPNVIMAASLRDRLSPLRRLGYSWLRLQRNGFRSLYHAGRIVKLSDEIAAADPNAQIVRPKPSDPAYIQPTGGTTGQPKAVLLTHRNLLSNALQVEYWTDRPLDEDVVLAALPFFHCYGLTACALSGIARGSTLVLQHRFRPTAVLRAIKQWRVTTLPAVPAMLAAVCGHLRGKHHDLSSLRECISGGAPLDPALAQQFRQLSGATIVEGYGLSEASPVTHAGPLDGSARPGTIGLPLADTDAKIVDPTIGDVELPTGQVGELIVRGPQVMAGYWHDPEGTERTIRDGWLYTGDLATVDEDGFFRIVDRKKDLIITSGFNVYPTEVEQVLRQFPGLADVAVLGVPDEQRGELVKAVVVPRKGERFNRKAFDEFARQHLAAYKRPRVVEVRDGDLPRNVLGKVLRRVLRMRTSEPIPAALPEETKS